MALVIKDGKLLTLGEGLATAKDPVDPCDCCQPDNPYGCCCYTDDKGQYVTEQMRASDCATMPNSSHTPNTKCDEVECPPSSGGTGKCCSYPYSSSGPQPANTAEEAIELAAASAKANSSGIEGSIWTVGTPEGVPWVEGEAWYDEARNQYECTGYWTLGERGECRSSTEAGCLSGPFSYFTPGATCEGPDGGLYDCPENPPVPGICLYREDGKGVCKTFAVEQSSSGCVATEEEAQQNIDDGIENLKQNPENQIDCFDAIGGFVDTRVTPTPNSGCPADKPFYYEIYNRIRNIGENEEPDGTCEPSYDTNRTEESCVESDYTPFPGGISAEDWNSLLSPEWAVDYPEANLGGWGPTHCKSVSSESECEELNGIFCERVTDCPDDLSAGCTEKRIRSNPLP